MTTIWSRTVLADAMLLPASLGSARAARARDNAEFAVIAFAAAAGVDLAAWAPIGIVSSYVAAATMKARLLVLTAAQTGNYQFDLALSAGRTGIAGAPTFNAATQFAATAVEATAYALQFITATIAAGDGRDDMQDGDWLVARVRLLDAGSDAAAAMWLRSLTLWQEV